MKTYTIELDEEKNTVTRHNTGFNAYELIGLLEQAKISILKQMTGEEASAKVIKKVTKTK